MKRRKLLLAAMVLSTCSVAIAQQTKISPPPPINRPSNQPTPQQISRFVANFEADVNKGCLKNPPQGARNQAGYCSCYAASYIKRYSPQELSLIGRVAGASNQNATIIALMMSPEIRECRLSN